MRETLKLIEEAQADGVVQLQKKMKGIVCCWNLFVCFVS